MSYTYADYTEFQEIFPVRDSLYMHHYPVSLIRRNLKLFGLDVPFDGMRKIATVRNPWARMVSLYESRNKTRGYVPDDAFPAVAAEFKEWLYCPTRPHDAVYISRPMVEWLGVDVETIKLESLTPKRLPFGKNMRRASQNIGTYRRSYRDYYDDESRQYVEYRFQEDIEAFKYEF